METPRFDANILTAARLLSDERTDASSGGDAGKTYESAVLSQYQNDAVKEIIRAKYEEVHSGIQAVFPEYMKTSLALSLASSAFAKPNEAWFVTEMATIGGVMFTLLVDDILRVITGADKIRVPSATTPYFYEEGRSVKTLGVTTGQVIARYVIQPQPVTVGGASDLLISDIYDRAIVSKMIEFAMADTKLTNPA